MGEAVGNDSKYRSGWVWAVGSRGGGGVCCWWVVEDVVSDTVWRGFLFRFRQRATGGLIGPGTLFSPPPFFFFALSSSSLIKGG